jgi:microcystin-dependent protein
MMVVAKYLDPADNQWKPIPVPPHVHPGGSTRIPGEVIAFAGTTPPAGWLICDGSEVKAADYPLLAAVLGTWGPGGVTFLPDLRDKSIVGFGSKGAIGQQIGNPTHGHTADPLPGHAHGTSALGAHTHGVPAGSTSSDSHNHAVNIAEFNTGAGGSHGHTTSSAGSHDHTMPTATQAVAPGQATIRHVTGVDTASAGSHSHSATSGGSHAHTANPPSTNSTSDAHSHTFSAARTGAVSGGTPAVDAAGGGTPTIHEADSYHPSTVLNYIIYTGA